MSRLSVQTKVNLSKVIGAAIGLGVLASCAAPAPIQTVKKGIYPLKATGAVTNATTPFIEVNGSNYLLAKACVPGRSFGDDADQRNFGDDADQRNFGDDADQRNFGDDADQRNFGDDADQRNFGDDADQRNFGDDADQRNFGDDADQRNFGDDADQRNFGDDADQRNFGDDADQRNFGDDADQRNFGDDVGVRNFGAAENQFKCVFSAADNAVYVTGFIGNEIIRANPGDVFTKVNNSKSYVIFRL